VTLPLIRHAAAGGREALKNESTTSAFCCPSAAQEGGERGRTALDAIAMDMDMDDPEVRKTHPTRLYTVTSQLPFGLAHQSKLSSQRLQTR
jgi:hypothetical protein